MSFASLELCEWCFHSTWRSHCSPILSLFISSVSYIAWEERLLAMWDSGTAIVLFIDERIQGNPMVSWLTITIYSWEKVDGLYCVAREWGTCPTTPPGTAKQGERKAECVLVHNLHFRHVNSGSFPKKCFPVGKIHFSSFWAFFVWESQKKQLFCFQPVDVGFCVCVC